MSEAPRQLPLDLPVDPAFGVEDFLVSPSNEAAYAFVEAWPDWPDARALLIGPPGSGKSHLGAIWAARAGAVIVPADRLEARALTEARAVLIEDIDSASARPADLFHALNLARETGIALLLTARELPHSASIALPDLLSRLRALPSVMIAEPDDALIRAVIVKLFVDRQIRVDTSVVDYLVRRIDRSLEAARQAVARLDSEALARGRRVTRAIAAAMLGALPPP